MTKHLFRPKFRNSKTEEELLKILISGSFSISDKVMKEHMDLHIIDVPMYHPSKKRITIYGRDLITEIGNNLFVKPNLGNPYFPKLIKSNFVKELRKIGYDKEIRFEHVLSEGGLLIVGNEFILMSDGYEGQSDKIRRRLKDFDVNIPVYYMPSLSNNPGSHIDFDYNVIDSLKIIYGSRDVFHGECEESEKGVSLLETIAKSYGYELREYKYNRQKENESDGSEDFAERITRGTKGLNFIKDENKIFTESIHPDEEKYLKNKGIEVIVVPLGKVDPGAGLRCVYGEFNI